MTPPDPNTEESDVLFTYLCRRCDKSFQVYGIAQQCHLCFAAAGLSGIIDSERIGEASGS